MKDRFVFWLDQNFMTYLLAYYLQDKIDGDFFAIYDLTNKTKKFFEKQNFVKFKKTWFYHDHIQLNKKEPDLSYLSNFEKRYDLNLWNLALNERLFYRFNKFYKFSKNEILSILEQECKFFEEILDEIKPNYLIMKETTLHNDELFYQMCKVKEIKILTSSVTKTLTRCLLSEDPRKFDSDVNLSSNGSLQTSFKELRKKICESNLSGNLQKYEQKWRSSNFELLKSGISFLSSKNSNVETHYTYFGRSKFKVVLDALNFKITKKKRVKFLNNNLDSDITSSEKFIYFPLGVNQERNLLIAAPYFTNQIEILRSIAKSIPIDYMIYVKDHVAQGIRGWRDISIYEEIMNIPNVKLLHHNTSNDVIYQKCDLVISIGGSPSLDAALYGKPSIIFSKLIFDVLPSVYYVHSIHDLPKTIQQALKTNVNVNDVANFINLLEKNSVTFDWPDYIQREANTFFFNGQLVDVNISNSQMERFLNDNKDKFNELTQAHVKKINWYKQKRF